MILFPINTTRPSLALHYGDGKMKIPISTLELSFYYVADRIDATLRMESLRRVYAYALTVTPDLDVNLIVDGGPENVNWVVDRFLHQNCITRQIALKDISFSNSMIEAANKLLKYRYLFPKQIENLAQLQKILKAAIEEYNQVKAHASLHGYTPLNCIMERLCIQTGFQRCCNRRESRG